MSTADREYSEKRDFIRMAMNAGVEVHPEGETQALKGTCSDLSATGMSVYLTQALAEGTQVRVVIASPNAQFDSLVATARVIRCEADAKSGFRLGLEIQSMQ
ncbi:MAG: PilZ domain-containing protein [Saccharospirillum sp.]